MKTDDVTSSVVVGAGAARGRRRSRIKGMVRIAGTMLRSDVYSVGQWRSVAVR
jgi:hypothetical protein